MPKRSSTADSSPSFSSSLTTTSFPFPHDTHPGRQFLRIQYPRARSASTHSRKRRSLLEPSPSSSTRRPTEARPSSASQHRSQAERPQSDYPDTTALPSRPVSRRSPSYDQFVRARRPTSLLSTDAQGAFKERTLLNRLSTTLDFAFPSLTPTHDSSEVRIQRAQATQITIAPSPKSDKRLSTSSASSKLSITSSNSNASASTSSSSTSVVQRYSDSKPFAAGACRTPGTPRQKTGHVASPLKELDISLPTVEEEGAPPPVPPKDIPDNMGLARSLTKRLHRSDSSSSSPFRSPPERKRPQISLPRLLSTTHQSIDDLPDVRPSSNGSTHSSTPSTPTSDVPTLTDSSSRSSSETEGSPLETPKWPAVAPNHLTQYFPSSPNSLKPVQSVTVGFHTPSVEAVVPPAIPMRSPSHSKREHVRLARARSLRSSGGSYAAAVANGIATPLSSSRHTSMEQQQSHPFSAELAQLAEVAEDFNSMVIEEAREDDEKIFADGGFARFTPSAYVSDLEDLERMRWMD